MWTTVKGRKVEYALDGDAGTWLVMSHSLGCDVRMWDAQVSALAGQYRVLRYDTRGHGQSDAGADPFTLEDLADDAAGLMDQLGIERAVWIGFSMGGMIGQVFAFRHPSRIQALVLADTTSEHHATPQAIWDERIRIARQEGIEPLVQPAIGRWFTERFRQEHPREVAKVASMIAGTSIDGWAGCCAAIAAVHTTPRLPEIDCPALVMVGELDIGTPLASALEIHRHLRDSVLVVISDAAHMTCIEQPSQFNRALLIFLNGAVTTAAV